MVFLPVLHLLDAGLNLLVVRRVQRRGVAPAYGGVESALLYAQDVAHPAHPGGAEEAGGRQRGDQVLGGQALGLPDGGLRKKENKMGSVVW